MVIVMPLSNEEIAAEYERYGEECPIEDQSDRSVPLSSAALRAIWSDRDRLRDWTWGLLFIDGDPFCREAYERACEENTRKWLLRLKREKPLRFTRLITRNRYLIGRHYSSAR
jgi:hypothetical protein